MREFNGTEPELEQNDRGMFVRVTFRFDRPGTTGPTAMKNEFTAIIERDDEWYIAFCPEIPEANGQGATRDEARESLAEAIALVLEDRWEEGL